MKNDEKKKKQLIAQIKSFIKQNTVDQQKRAEFFLKLVQFFKKNNIPPMEIMNYLQTTSVSSSDPSMTFAMIIVRDEKEESNYHLIRLLQQLSEQPEVFLNLLKIQNNGGRNLGMLIACHQNEKINYAFMELIRDLQIKTKWSDFYELIRQESEIGWSFGMIVMKFQDLKTVNLYLKILANLQNQLSVFEFYRLMKRQNQQGYTFGMMLVTFGCEIALEKYLEILKHLADQLSPDRFCRFLQIQNAENDTLDMIIARSKNDNMMQIYLHFLNEFADKLTPEQLYQFLDRQGKNHQTLGMLIAEHRNEECMQLYLKLIYRLFNRGRMDLIFDLLNLKDSEQFNLGMRIAERKNEKNMRLFLDLLWDLHDKAPKKLYELLTYNEFVHGKNFPAFIYQHYNRDITNNKYRKMVIALLTLNLLENNIKSERFYRNYAPYKSFIFDYILTLDLARKEKALRASLDENCQLGKYFWIKRGFFKPNLKRGTLLKLSDELKKLEAEKEALAKEVDRKSTRLNSSHWNSHLVCRLLLE